MAVQSHQKCPAKMPEAILISALTRPPPPTLTPAPSRWAANNWPSKILGQIELVRQQHMEEEEKFHKIQIMDQNNFQEKLEGLQVGFG